MGHSPSVCSSYKSFSLHLLEVMGEVKERRAGRWAGPLCTVGGLCVPANTCYTQSRTLHKPDCFVNLTNTANLALQGFNIPDTVLISEIHTYNIMSQVMARADQFQTQQHVWGVVW